MTGAAKPEGLAAEAWTAFCEALKASGEALLANETPEEPLNQAEGLRYLSRVLRFALERQMEGADPDFPLLTRSCHESLKQTADSPDYHYQIATLRGDRDYRLRTTRGEAETLWLGTYSGTETTGVLDIDSLKPGPDGMYEVIVSAREHPGAWLPMRADTTFMQVRNIFRSPARRNPAQVTIERIGAPPTPAPAEFEAMRRGLLAAAGQLAASAGRMQRFTAEVRDQAWNRFDFDQEGWQRVGGAVNTYYARGYWRLEPGEALLVETDVPEASYYSFQLNNVWIESLDYVHHPIHVSKWTARLAADGRLRIVVAHEDPGLPNWLDTAGHRQGTMVWKWNDVARTPNTTAKVVRVSELAREST